MPKTGKITKATKAKAKTQVKTKNKTKTKAESRERTKKAESSLSRSDVVASVAADATEAASDFLQRLDTSALKSQKVCDRSDQNEPDYGNYSPTPSVEVPTAWLNWSPSNHSDAPKVVNITAKQPDPSWNVGKEPTRALLSGLSVSRAPVIHAMPALKVLLQWLENDLQNDLDPDDPNPQDKLDYHETYLTTEELRMYNVVGLRAHCALAIMSEERRSRVRWQIVVYRGSKEPVIGNLWFAVLIRPNEKENMPHSSAHKIYSEVPKPIEHGPLDGNFYWDESRKPGDRQAVVSAAAKSSQSDQQSGDKKPVTKNRGFCWGWEACGPSYSV